MDRLHALATALYDTNRATALCTSIRALAARYAPQLPPSKTRGRMTSADAVLIIYPDQVRAAGQPGLETLGAFFAKHLTGTVNAVHILPFYPYTSDDGFSVIDYMEVAEGLGGWNAVERLGGQCRLMFDAVLNHMSAQSPWFRAFLNGEDAFRDFFITRDPDEDLSMVTRPRTSPLLTAFETPEGLRWIWTTFSNDQVDLNYANPAVLLRIIEVLLFYVSKGARIIRLDAIAYLWKEAGTSCIHLPGAHTVVKILRAVLDEAAPEVMLITETNVPHAENISYFGDGTDEAQLVYQFPLPPLTAHALLKENSTWLNRWCAGLERPSADVTFFNFTASHDGIGVRPLDGLVPEGGLEFMTAVTVRRGGYVSYKNNPDGSRSPYELNINYRSLLTLPDEDPELAISRFLVSQAIMLAMPGVPGIYFHSLVGSVNDKALVEITGRFRSINRAKPALADLEQALAAGEQRRIFDTYRMLLRKRAGIAAFDPYGGHAVIDCGTSVFAIRRNSPGTPPLIAVHNVTSSPVSAVINADELKNLLAEDVLTGTDYKATDGLITVTLKPFGFAWLMPASL